jgi:4'-phosphopantetheinyl transferase EntD
MFGPQAIGAGVVTRTPGCAGTGSESDRATVGSPTSGCKPDRTGTTLPDIGTAELELNANSSDPGNNPAMQSVLGWLRAWLPPGCGWAAGPITDRAAGAFADEEQLIGKSVRKRRNEFRAGRDVARQALAQVGCAPTAILARPQRDPIWPQGFLGSITHSERFALAIAAPSRLMQAVGVDLEDDPKLDRRLVSIVCRADERHQAPKLAQLGIDHAKLCFVTKEAVFKAIFPQQRSALEFEQLRVSFDLPECSFSVSIRNADGDTWSHIAGIGRFLCNPTLLVAAFVIPQSSNPGWS